MPRVSDLMLVLQIYAGNVPCSSLLVMQLIGFKCKELPVFRVAGGSF